MAYKVTYDIKHVNKESDMYGVLCSGFCKFRSFDEAVQFVRQMRSKVATKYQVIGMPVIERI
jgi:pentatricopeptide repeat protein